LADSTSDQRGTAVDDLTVARRAYLRVLERLARLNREAHDALRILERSARELKEAGHRDVAQRLEAASYVWRAVSRRGTCYIDGQPAALKLVTRGTHRYRGMFHPPAPPTSPQELGAVAVVCTCLEELTNAAEMRQHWEAGCFDAPAYRTIRPIDKRLVEAECLGCGVARWFIDSATDGTLASDEGGVGGREYACLACGRTSSAWRVRRQSPPGFMNWRLGLNGLTHAEFDHWLDLLRAHNPRHPRLTKPFPDREI
jgi:hypothetical protein